eukprot:757051-Rhodomonas_salina.1
MGRPGSQLLLRSVSAYRCHYYSEAYQHAHARTDVRRGSIPLPVLTCSTDLQLYKAYKNMRELKRRYPPTRPLRHARY